MVCTDQWSGESRQRRCLLFINDAQFSKTFTAVFSPSRLKNSLHGANHIEVILKRPKIRYRYLTCDELKNKPSNIKQAYTAEDSLGAYVGWINKGAYILGMGSTDVYFEVEISKDKKGLGVYTDEIHTFL